MRAKLRAARQLGISLRRYEGWEPAEVTRPGPDGSTVTYREPEWTPHERALMDALIDWEDHRCPCGCGQDVRESLSDAPEKDATKWQAGIWQCAAGHALAQSMDVAAEADRAESERTQRPVFTSHRIWEVRPRPIE